MLSGEIDRNRGAEPAKKIVKVDSSARSHLVSEALGRQDFSRHLRRRKGVVIQTGEGAAGTPANINPQTHDIVTVALIKDPACHLDFKVGDEIFVEPVVGHSGVKPKAPDVKSGPEKPSITSPESGKADDYVVHITGSQNKIR